MIKNIINNYFLLLFSLIPLSILIGPAISLSLIIIIDLSFIILMISFKKYDFLKNKNLIFFYLLFLYLIFNTLISLDASLSLTRNFGFIRIIILFLAINYFFRNTLFLKKVMIFWIITLSIVIFDVFFETYFGKNILGFPSQGNRIVSFFSDEPIVGWYLNSFYLIVVGYLFNNLEKINKYYILLISFIILISIFLTGERSNSIKAFLGISLFFTLLPILDIKKKIIIFLSFFGLIFLVIYNSSFLKVRFVHQIKNILLNKDVAYIQLYKSGYQVFKNNFIFGVGNKNYRVETCNKDISKNLKKNDLYICETHPHQIYFEILSEHGIFGFLIIFWLLYKLVFSKIKLALTEKNFLQNGCFIYIFLVFLPLLPSGALFGDLFLTIFAINLSIFYACSKKLNVFTNIN